MLKIGQRGARARGWGATQAGQRRGEGRRHTIERRAERRGGIGAAICAR